MGVVGVVSGVVFVVHLSESFISPSFDVDSDCEDDEQSESSSSSESEDTVLSDEFGESSEKSRSECLATNCTFVISSSIGEQKLTRFS